MEAAEAVIADYLTGADIEWELGGRRGEYVITLPGEQKLKTVVSLVVREKATSVSAFVIRNPDENHEAFYRHLLRKNLRMPLPNENFVGVKPAACLQSAP